MENRELYLILHNIRSAHNVGAIFRTADGAGVSKIYLSGYTQVPAKPDAVFKTKAEKMIEKTALGAEKSVEWHYWSDGLSELFEKFRQDGCSIIALEKTKTSIDISKFESSFPAALFLGNEVEGISPEILQKCDAVVSLPMRGIKESLNVSVAAGIAMYEILK